MAIIHSNYSYKEIEGTETVKDDDPALVAYFNALDEELIPRIEDIQAKKDAGELKAGEYLLQ